MEIALKDLMSLMEQAVSAGVQKYVKSIEPAADYVKQAEAKRYISRLGYKPAMLQHWVNARLLTPVKTGEAQNAVVLYSLSDLQNLISSLQLKGITNKGGHDFVR